MTFEAFYALTLNATEFTDPEAFTAECGGSIQGELPIEQLLGILVDVYAYAHDRSMNTIRAISGLSRAAFARDYRIPIRSLEDWEAGRHAAPPYVLDLLAYAVVNRERG